MRLPGDDRIDEAMRGLVRAKVLEGWRTYSWRCQMWTIVARNPLSGKPVTADLTRSEAMALGGVR